MPRENLKMTLASKPQLIADLIFKLIVIGRFMNGRMAGIKNIHSKGKSELRQNEMQIQAVSLGVTLPRQKGQISK
jgi:hypothetical protein